MNIHDATEIAFKNGRECGRAELATEILKDVRRAIKSAREEASNWEIDLNVCLDRWIAFVEEKYTEGANENASTLR